MNMLPTHCVHGIELDSTEYKCALCEAYEVEGSCISIDTILARHNGVEKALETSNDLTTNEGNAAHVDRGALLVIVLRLMGRLNA